MVSGPDIAPTVLKPDPPESGRGDSRKNHRGSLVFLSPTPFNSVEDGLGPPGTEEDGPHSESTLTTPRDTPLGTGTPEGWALETDLLRKSGRGWIPGRVTR